MVKGLVKVDELTAHQETTSYLFLGVCVYVKKIHKYVTSLALLAYLTDRWTEIRKIKLSMEKITRNI